MATTQQSFEPISCELDEIGRQIVDAAFKVHTTLGPGLLESVYEICLGHELDKRGLHLDHQVPVTVHYDGIRILKAYKMDILVARAVVIEIKSVDKLLPVHTAQLLTYMKLAGHRLGYLINFNESVIRNGIRRKVL